MAYTKPVCDCGSELYFHQEVAYVQETSINKDGRMSKRPKNSSHLEATWLRLRCNDCDQEWDFDEDSKGRILRKEKWGL